MGRLAGPAVLVLLVAAGCGGSSRDAGPPAAWTRATTPEVSGTGLLTGVSCVSRSFCVAVGSRLHRLVSHTLVERWDGTSWRIMPTVGPADSRSNLTGVSCVSPAFCAAVGSHFTDGGSRGLIEIWNGTSWRVTPTAGSPVTYALAGVSCTSPSFCVAVGTTHGGVSQPLVQTWRGKGWSLAAGQRSRGAASLAGVSCVAGPFCVAVGQRSSGSVVSTFAESFDGTRPRAERSPSVSSFSSLAGVSCLMREWCVAVGGHYHGQGTETLVLRRERAWSLRPSPSRSFMSGFSATSCVDETACVAVGSQRAGEANHTLVAGWDGTEWTIPPSPNPPGTDILSGVSCVSDGKGVLCFAVGTAGPLLGIGGKPLVLRGTR
jgi:hypothetical protein